MSHTCSCCPLEAFSPPKGVYGGGGAGAARLFRRHINWVWRHAVASKDVEATGRRLKSAPQQRPRLDDTSCDRPLDPLFRSRNDRHRRATEGHRDLDRRTSHIKLCSQGGCFMSRRSRHGTWSTLHKLMWRIRRSRSKRPSAVRRGGLVPNSLPFRRRKSVAKRAVKTRSSRRGRS